MSVSHERPYSQESPLTGVAELLLQEKVRKNLKAALGIIEWDKNSLQREGKAFYSIGTFISPSAKLYEIARVEGSDQYSVWRYGLDELNAAGRPIAPTMQEYRVEQGSSEGVVRLSQGAAEDEITIDTSNPQVISVEGSRMQALEASQLLQQHGVTSGRR